MEDRTVYTCNVVHGVGYCDDYECVYKLYSVVLCDMTENRGVHRECTLHVLHCNALLFLFPPGACEKHTLQSCFPTVGSGK